MTLRMIFDAAREVLFPERAVCLGCGDLTGLDDGPWLCGKCRRCMRFGFHVLNPDAVDLGRLGGVAFAAYYEKPVRGIVRAIKFGGVYRAIPYLAQGLAPMVEALDTKFDMVMGVPLHPRRKRDRGFDQGYELAKCLSHLTGIPLGDGLRRVRYTRRQAKMSIADRRNNVSGAFACDRSMEGARILLVDDVYTTGATMRACADALHGAGAAEVWGLAAAGSRYFRSHGNILLRKRV